MRRKNKKLLLICTIVAQSVAAKSRICNVLITGLTEEIYMLQPGDIFEENKPVHDRSQGVRHYRIKLNWQ